MKSLIVFYEVLNKKGESKGVGSMAVRAETPEENSYYYLINDAQEAIKLKLGDRLFRVSKVIKLD